MARRKSDDDEATTLELGDRPPSAYSLNSEMAAVAEQLITRHDVQLGHLRNFTLAYQRRQTERVDESWDVDGVARSWIASDRERGLHTFDGGIWIRGPVWDRLQIDQRRALLLHHLLHLQMTPKHALKRVSHDVAEFALVARVYGAWEDTLGLFATALDAHERKEPETLELPRPAVVRDQPPTGEPH